jgi:hypothetical protein
MIKVIKEILPEKAFDFGKVTVRHTYNLDDTLCDEKDLHKFRKDYVYDIYVNQHYYRTLDVRDLIGGRSYGLADQIIFANYILHDTEISSGYACNGVSDKVDQFTFIDLLKSQYPTVLVQIGDQIEYEDTRSGLNEHIYSVDSLKDFATQNQNTLTEPQMREWNNFMEAINKEPHPAYVRFI